MAASAFLTDTGSSRQFNPNEPSELDENPPKQIKIDLDMSASPRIFDRIPGGGAIQKSSLGKKNLRNELACVFQSDTVNARRSKIIPIKFIILQKSMWKSPNVICLL